MGSAANPAAYAERLAARRRGASFNAFTAAIESSVALEVPSAVERVEPRREGVAPKLSAEAIELARQVYYLQHGTVADAARAIIAAGLSDTDSPTRVHGRLRTWWAREKWPKRSGLATIALRDAQNDGGLYRGRLCIDVTRGHGPAPAGKRCSGTALPDSDYCFSHDPRPEYVERRRRQTERLVEGRRAGMVALKPFQEWCDATRRRMLAEARERGERVHPNSQGWKLLADAMGIDNTILHRLCQGKHSSRDRPPVTMIRAATVARYVEPLGVAFQDIYGADPPVVEDDYGACPGCGGRKNHLSFVCLDCHRRSLGEPCPYVNRRGERCDVPTRHESGYCASCRRIVFRVHRPRPGRASFVTTPMLILALDQYLELPQLAWVARRMWAVNAGGVRDVFSSPKTLTGSLVKQFRKRDWSGLEAAGEARADLVAAHGEVPWPESDGAVDLDLEAAGVVPFGPFCDWLADRYSEVGSYAKLARRVRMNPDNLSRWLRGVETTDSVRRATVDRALDAWGDGTTYSDIYAKGIQR